MSIVDGLPETVAMLRADQKALLDRVSTLEKSILVIETERAHMSKQVDAIRGDVKSLNGTFYKVAMTIIGTVVVAFLTFALNGGLVKVAG